MAAMERVIPLVGHLPISIRDALARRLRELMGLGLIAVAMVATAALATWSVQDPSFSHATSRAIRNMVGYPGAIFSDLLMQLLGLGAIMMVLPIAVWGWRMVTHRNFDREPLRLGCWLLCMVIAAGVASCWPRSASWPLPTGLGGVVGDALVRAPAVVFGPPGFAYRLILGIVLSAAMIATFMIASGLGSRPLDEDDLPEIRDEDAPFEQDEEDGGSVKLGWAFHALMSAKARLTWFLIAAYRSLVSSGAQPRGRAFERQEPNLGGRNAPPSPRRRTKTSRRKRKRTKTRRPPAPHARSLPLARLRANRRNDSICRRSRCWPRPRPRTASRSPGASLKTIPARSKACCRILACAARS